MNLNLSRYRIGLMLTRSGLNDRQLIAFRAYLQETAKMCTPPVTLVVPVVRIHDGAERAHKLTERLLAPLIKGMDTWLTVEALEAEAGSQEEMSRLIAHLGGYADEVWCATSAGTGSEWHMRPGRMFQAAQATKFAPRFKMLHYWIELDPKHLPTRDAGKGKKKPALKGW